jgi:hypothetical protein
VLPVLAGAGARAAVAAVHPASGALPEALAVVAVATVLNAITAASDGAVAATESTSAVVAIADNGAAAAFWATLAAGQSVNLRFSRSCLQVLAGRLLPCTLSMSFFVAELVHARRGRNVRDTGGSQEKSKKSPPPRVTRVCSAQSLSTSVVAFRGVR